MRIGPRACVLALAMQVRSNIVEQELEWGESHGMIALVPLFSIIFEVRVHPRVRMMRNCLLSTKVPELHILAILKRRKM